MSDYTTHDAITLAAQGEASKFKEAVNDILMSKVADAISLEKFNVAQSMFGEPEQTEEGSDEDV